MKINDKLYVSGIQFSVLAATVVDDDDRDGGGVVVVAVFPPCAISYSSVYLFFTAALFLI